MFGGLGQLNDGVAVYTFENAALSGGVRRAPRLTRNTLSPVHFRDLAIGIQHDCLETAGPDRFDFGENVVQVVQRLDAWMSALG